jgi:hypothetical protein
MSKLVKTGKEITQEIKKLYEGHKQVLNKLDELEKKRYLVLPLGLDVLEEMLEEESEKCRCPECHMEMGCYSHFCDNCKQRVGVVEDYYLPPGLISSVFARFKKENGL